MDKEIANSREVMLEDVDGRSSAGQDQGRDFLVVLALSLGRDSKERPRLAIISCPHCGKPTSSKAPSCRACNASLDGENHPENARLAARARREQARSMASQAVLATLIGVAGGCG